PRGESRTSRPWGGHSSAIRRARRCSCASRPGTSLTRSSRSPRAAPPMDWADELAASVEGPQVVNDSKTPSGTVHVGSLRGPVVHDAIWRALRERGTDARFLYGVDDLDAMDAAALLTPDAVERYMGAPLSRVPAPEGSLAASYARHFVGNLFF